MSEADDTPDLAPDAGAPESPLRFPCRFPIKAMGRAGSGVEAEVLAIVARHAPGTAADAMTTRPSSGGKWVAVTITIEATSRAQLDAIYRDLTAHDLVAYAL